MARLNAPVHSRRERGLQCIRETHRFYRYQHQAPKGWESFQVKYRETDLWIRARRNLEREAAQAVLSCRLQLEKLYCRP